MTIELSRRFSAPFSVTWPKHTVPPSVFVPTCSDLDRHMCGELWARKDVSVIRMWGSVESCRWSWGLCQWLGKEGVVSSYCGFRCSVLSFGPIKHYWRLHFYANHLFIFFFSNYNFRSNSQVGEPKSFTHSMIFFIFLFYFFIFTLSQDVKLAVILTGRKWSKTRQISLPISAK